MNISCPYCGDSIKYDESLGGKRVVCRYCKRPLRMPFVAQLPADYQEEFRREQDKLRKKAQAAEQKRLLAQQREAERKRTEAWLEQERERQSQEARLRQEAEAARQQQYAKALVDAKAEPDRPKIWHCSIKGTQRGPIKESMLQKWIDDGVICGADHVRVEGRETWIRLSDLPERFHIPIHAGPVQVAIAQVADSNTVRCPKCGCTQLSTEKKGMDASSACCGALLLGPLGLLCGLQGANRVVITCLKCGHQWTRGKG